MIFIVFSGAFNGFDPLILLKIIKNEKNIQPKENLSKISMPLDDTMQGFQYNQCLKFIDFKDTKMHQRTNACFQCKKGVKRY